MDLSSSRHPPPATFQGQGYKTAHDENLHENDWDFSSYKGSTYVQGREKKGPLLPNPLPHGGVGSSGGVILGGRYTQIDRGRTLDAIFGRGKRKTNEPFKVRRLTIALFYVLLKPTL